MSATRPRVVSGLIHTPLPDLADALAGATDAEIASFVSYCERHTGTSTPHLRLGRAEQRRRVSS